MSTTDPTTPEPAAEPVVVDPAAEPAAAPEPLIEPEAPVYTAPAADHGPELGTELGTETSEVIVAEVVEEEPAPAFAPPAAAYAPTPPEAAYAPAPGYTAEAAYVPAPGAPAPGQPQIVYVQPITPPKKKGNRGVGALLVLVATVIFAAALVGIAWLLEYFLSGSTGVGFLFGVKFWLPVIAFAVAFLVVTLLANRAAWWAHILGSLVVAAAVYFAAAGGAVLVDLIYGVAKPTTFAAGLTEPFVILAAVVAREVAIWTGAILSRRGRKLKARNAEARAAYEREAAERRAATGY